MLGPARCSGGAHPARDGPVPASPPSASREGPRAAAPPPAARSACSSARTAAAASSAAAWPSSASAARCCAACGSRALLSCSRGWSRATQGVKVGVRTPARELASALSLQPDGSARRTCPGRGVGYRRRLSPSAQGPGVPSVNYMGKRRTSRLVASSSRGRCSRARAASAASQRALASASARSRAAARWACAGCSAAAASSSRTRTAIPSRCMVACTANEVGSSARRVKVVERGGKALRRRSVPG